MVALVLALVASAAAFVPLAFTHGDRATLPQVFNGSTAVYAVPLAGGAPREVLRLHGQWGFPVATRDGRALLLERPSVVRGTGVWRAPLDGAAPTLVRKQELFAAPRTGPYVATERLTRPRSTGWRMDLAVRRGPRLVWTRRMPFPLGAAAASPDGSLVALVRMHLLELWSPHGRRLLAQDAQQAQAPVWTRDGRAVLYWNASGALVVRDVRTRASRVLLRGRYFDDALSADGRTVYVLGLNAAVSIPK